jgi:hypothetical protein
MEEELSLSRRWIGSVESGVPGYELQIDGVLNVTIAIHDKYYVAGLVKSNGVVTHWEYDLAKLLQWLANTIGLPVSIDDQEAVYPEEDFDDGDDGNYTEEDFDDGDDDSSDEDFDDGDEIEENDTATSTSKDVEMPEVE